MLHFRLEAVNFQLVVENKKKLAKVLYDSTLYCHWFDVVDVVVLQCKENKKRNMVPQNDQLQTLTNHLFDISIAQWRALAPI